jgi:hypothetical protein
MNSPLFWRSVGGTVATNFARICEAIITDIFGLTAVKLIGGILQIALVSGFRVDRDTSGRIAIDRKQPKFIEFQREETMSDVVYVSKSSTERKQGPLRIAHLPGESEPVIFSVHGAIAEHYKVDPAKLKESHSSTIDM